MDSFNLLISSTTNEPDHLVLVSGDAQTASAGNSIDTNPKVKVVDASGNPVSGVVLTFTVTGGGGNVGSGTVTTDALGMAETSYTLGSGAGANTMVVARQGTALPGVPSTLTFTETGKVVNLEVPIMMLGNGVSSENAVHTFSRTQTQLNTTDYDGVVTYDFEIVAINTNAAAKTVDLVDAGGNTVGSISVTGATATATRFRSSFTPNAGADVYSLKLAATPIDDELIVHTARIIVKQVGATKTRIYFPLLVTPNNATGYHNGDWGTTGAIAEDNTTYDQTSNIRSYMLWRKDSSIWKRLSGATPWTFEATAYNQNATIGKVSVFNKTTNTQVTATELTVNNSTSFNHLSVDFSNTATNFTDGHDFEIRTMLAAGQYIGVDHAGIWVKLDHLEQGETYYTVGAGAYYFSGIVTQQRSLLNLGFFSNPVPYFETNALVDAATTMTVTLEDHGTNDSGSAGTSTVLNSTMSFTNSIAKERQRSPALSLTDGNRYLISSDGNKEVNGVIAVGFSW